jgi:hypothetical protein
MPDQTTTSTSSIDPALLPYLTTGLERASNLFLTGQQPTFFPGQTYVDPSQATTDALAQQEALARGQNQVLNQAQQTFMTGLTAQSQASPLFQNIYNAAQQPAAGSDVLRQTAAGGFLNANPYQQQMMQAATRPLEQQFSQQVLPGISSLYSKSGRLGSGSMERALGTATEGFGRALGDVTSNIAGSQFQAERNLQQQAAGTLGAQELAAYNAQLQAASGLGSSQAQDLSRQMQGSLAASQIYGQQFLPSQMLAEVGTQREGIEGQQLAEEMARFQFNQQLPYQQLQGYLSSVYGSPMGGYGTQTTQTPTYNNRTTNALAGGLAGGLVGYGLNKAFDFGSPYLSAGGGALIGGLLGGL